MGGMGGGMGGMGGGMGGPGGIDPRALGAMISQMDATQRTALAERIGVPVEQLEMIGQMMAQGGMPGGMGNDGGGGGGGEGGMPPGAVRIELT